MHVSPAARCSVLLLTGALLLTACGSSTSTSGKSDGSTSQGVTLDNRGQEVTVKGPPKRAMSLNQGTTEIMLSLGLADRMVGTATWTDPVTKHLEKANAKVPRIADNAPSFEKVLGTEPDFVASSFASTLSKGGVAPREKFEEVGVPTYLSPADCEGKDNSGSGDGSRTKPLTMDTVYREVRELARIFGVEKRGEKLVSQLRGRVTKAKAATDAEGATVLYWFANRDSPFMAGCCGAPGIITNTLGAKNVFDDDTQEWPQINWETVANRNPEVIVLGDLTRESQTAETAAQKIAFLESNRVTRHMEAVRKKRYVRLSGQAMNPTIRTVEGVEKVAAALRSYGFDG
ncbi:ABC transporter substrate-binding protein [Streptomyces oceani]|uniref:ABC transporter substrate-binding protein n=1 Tax=Streptomyces oceani TaxID=1075402 RepID=A0A1E7KP61_9ACTN|nr:ABC transporter substrate-binding protein [Streptomyces oceani]OEV05769.1 ABC transporter substrate-binding protein [Streptomyces oceani]